MLGFLHSFFPSLNSGNELNLKPSPLKVKKRVSYENETSPLIQKDKMKEKSGSILKVVMRKEAASRLLSKCKNGGVLEYEDVAQDLKTLPCSYVRVFPYNPKDE